MSMTNQVLSFLTEAKGPIDAEVVMRGTGFDRRQVQPIVNILYKRGVLNRLDRGRYSINQKNLLKAVGNTDTSAGTSSLEGDVEEASTGTAVATQPRRAPTRRRRPLPAPSFRAPSFPSEDLPSSPAPSVPLAPELAQEFWGRYETLGIAYGAAIQKIHALEGLLVANGITPDAAVTMEG